MCVISWRRFQMAFLEENLNSQQSVLNEYRSFDSAAQLRINTLHWQQFPEVRPPHSFHCRYGGFDVFLCFEQPLPYGRRGSKHDGAVAVAFLASSKGSKYPIFEGSGAERKPYLEWCLGTRVVKYWVLGPSGSVSGYIPSTQKPLPQPGSLAGNPNSASDAC